MVKVRGKRVVVTRLGKSTPKRDDFYVKIPDSSDCTGEIKYLGSELLSSSVDLEGLSEGAIMDLKVGDKVVFGPKVQQIKLEGIDVLVMDEENILAVIKDEDEGKQA